MPGLWMGLVLSATAAEVPRWQVAVSSDRLVWLGSVAWLPSAAWSVDVQWRPPFAGRDDLAVGLTARRLETPLLEAGAAGEVGLRMAYAPVGRVYRPCIALEGGWSGAAHFDWADWYGEGWEEKQPVSRADYAPLFTGVAAEPLRFSFGPGTVSALGLAVGQLGWGRVLRARVSLVGIGVQF